MEHHLYHSSAPIILDMALDIIHPVTAQDIIPAQVTVAQITVLDIPALDLHVLGLISDTSGDAFTNNGTLREL